MHIKYYNLKTEIIYDPYTKSGIYHAFIEFMVDGTFAD